MIGLGDVQLYEKEEHLFYPERIFNLIGEVRVGGIRRGVKDICSALQIDYSNLRKACRGERSLPELHTRIATFLSIDPGAKSRLDYEYDIHRRHWNAVDKRRTDKTNYGSIKNEYSKILSDKIERNGFSLTDLFDEEKRAFIADSVIEGLRMKGKAPDAIRFGLCMLMWIEDNYVCIDHNLALSIGSISRLISYCAYTINDKSLFKKMLEVLRKSADQTNDNWLRGGYLHNIRRGMMESFSTLEDPRQLLITAKMAYDASMAGRATETDQPAARFWEPSHYLTLQALLYSKAVLGSIHPSDIDFLNVATEEILSQNDQVDFRLVSALGMSDLLLRSGQLHSAKQKVDEVMSTLDYNFHTYFGIRAFARRIQGDIAFLQSVDRPKGSRSGFYE